LFHLTNVHVHRDYAYGIARCRLLYWIAHFI